MNPTPHQPAWYLITRHWLSMLGAALTTTAGISWLFVLPLHIRGHADNPYIGIIVFLILPAVFFAGLALMPIGVYLSKHHITKHLAEPTFDRRAAFRKLAWFLGITTLLNLVIGTQITYRAVEYMETPQFCGSSCHTMAPEFAAYHNSPHSKVECVECHVAPGVQGWIESKKNGTRQLVETVLRIVPHPIPSALASNRLVPARETCENCHWPQKFAGVRLRVYSEFADDEANTRSETVLLMMVGGDRFSGIHGAHFGPGVHIRYASTDPARQTIPRVEYQNTTTGETHTFVAADPPDTSKAPNASNVMQEYDMQCVDCHNRPTHEFELPERAMNKAMSFGEIPVTLPFIKKEGVEVLKASYSTREIAADTLPKNLASFYQQKYPDVYSKRAQDIERAGKAVLAIYNRNVFPELKVTWGTYPNNLGHMDFPGCFRCHDGSHTTKDGKTITQDCNTCHQPLATSEASPEILKTLGIEGQILKNEKY
jgi:nitrate/TMAO reductase-like tetraheme cytochrome c subunit